MNLLETLVEALEEARRREDHEDINPFTGEDLDGCDPGCLRCRMEAALAEAKRWEAVDATSTLGGLAALLLIQKEASHD